MQDRTHSFGYWLRRRRKALDLTQEALAQRVNCSGFSIRIEGEPGIGKSRLMREVARHAEAEGLSTLATNCYEIERAIPYQPVIDLVTRALDRASKVALSDLAPVSLAELATLVPAVAERFPGLPKLSGDFPQARQARLLRAVDQLIEASRERRPLLHPESLDQSQLLAIYERRGAARAQAGQTHGAVADFRRVLDTVRAGGEREKAHYANAEPAAAIACYTRSLGLARDIADKSYECENLMMIGHACVGTKGLGDYPRASASLEAALEIARAADLQWHVGPTILGLDHVRACTGRYGEAWSGMQKTLGWLESLAQVRYQLIAYDFIGYLLLDLGHNERALEYLDRGLALARDTGIMFWRATIDAHAAVARSRLGQTDVAPALEATLEQTRRACERYLMVRCLDGLAEIALAAGDASRCKAYGDDLLATAEGNGLRELEGVARRWRGEALLAQKAYGHAQVELSCAAALAKAIGRVRLQMDAGAALARVFRALGQRDAAQRHEASARAIARAVEKSLESSGLEARLGMSGDST